MIVSMNELETGLKPKYKVIITVNTKAANCIGELFACNIFWVLEPT